MEHRIDEFNQTVGHIFAALYREFPVPLDIDHAAIAEALGVTVEFAEGTEHSAYGRSKVAKKYGNLPSGTQSFRLISETLKWLQKEGFITSKGDMASHEVQLTSRALAVMNALPESVANRERLGETLTKAVKGAGTEAGRTMIADTVGLIIGGVVKSFS